MSRRTGDKARTNVQARKRRKQREKTRALKTELAASKASTKVPAKRRATAK